MAVLPALTTERCTLESFNESHLSERYVSWLNDPEVVRFSVQRFRRHTVDSCRVYMESFRNTPHYFAAITAHDPALGHIGNINAYVDETNKIADVGIMVGEKRVWGKGYGVEAWMAMCQFLLVDLGLRKVTAGTVSANKGMLGIMRRANMRQDGVRYRHYLIEGLEVDLVYMALFREDLAAT